MELEGRLIDFDRVYQAIENLNNFEKDKAVQAGLKSATALFIQAGKANLKARMKNKKGDSGTMLKSFKNKVKRAKLGALAGFSAGGAQAHLLDRGTDYRFTKKGKYRGKIIANNFWTDAIKQNEDAAIDKVYSGIERAIQNLINK